MTKKFIIKEAWITDKNSNEIKIKPLKEDDIPNIVELENVNGGYGNVNYLKRRM